jgi:hypothetical protein
MLGRKDNKTMSEIQTSSHLYKPVYGCELPKKEYDWWKGLLHDNLDDGEFICYKGSYYYLGDCMRIDSSMVKAYPELKGWDGYWDDTFFSLVVCKYDNENDGYRMGLFFS